MGSAATTAHFPNLKKMERGSLIAPDQGFLSVLEHFVLLHDFQSFFTLNMLIKIKVPRFMENYLPEQKHAANLHLHQLFLECFF